MFFNTARMVQPEPGFIVGPISGVLGFVLDFIFNIMSALSMPLALGLSIIVFTIVIRIILLPLAIKMHKNMEKMRTLKPAMDKINAKYAGKKDPDSTRQKNMEIQAMYKESGANPLSGCLPLLVQMPIFITLFSMFQRPYMYISQLGDVYSRIAQQVMMVPGYDTIIAATHSIGLDKLPQNIQLYLGFGIESELMRLFNTYTPTDWDTLLYVMPNINYDYMVYLLAQKDIMEHFLTISLVAPAGILLPGVALPIISALSTFLTSKLMIRQQQNMGGDQSAMAIQQKIILYVMPVMMGAITITAPAGVGLYWVANNFFQLFQHMALVKIAAKKEAEKEEKKE
ncbi:MAG: YidC/Oxa1 family membrane protein insertase [Defluviitaleaceae bacterium]|nr:YidC/Oxa1 family membrane protein insertase [Defluviitaleaceae bacterium]